MSESKDPKRKHLRVIDGGKTRVRHAYEACKANGSIPTDVSVITVLSADDAAYAAEIAARRKA